MIGISLCDYSNIDLHYTIELFLILFGSNALRRITAKTDSVLRNLGMVVESGIHAFLDKVRGSHL